MFMTTRFSSPPHPQCRAASRQEARVSLTLLLLVLAIAGLSALTYWVYSSARGSRSDASNGTAPAPALSSSTRAILQRATAPVEIRFYSLLDPESVSPELFAFADRVAQLLLEYQNESGGKVHFIRVAEWSEVNAQAASGDGIQPFNLDKGKPCYLGLALIRGAQKSSIPRLDPQWEQAVEFDLSRALARLDEPHPAAPAFTAAPTQREQAAIDAVKRLIPDLSAVTVEQGTQILRQSAFQQYAAAVKEMEGPVQQAQQRLREAQESGSEADREAARKNLQSVQAQQVEKLQQIAADSQAQVTAFQRLKQDSR
jgi:hypothetical protein